MRASPTAATRHTDVTTRSAGRPTRGPARRSLDEAGYRRAERHLERCDPVLGSLVRRVGACRLAARHRGDHLTALVSSLVSQQLSTKAAAAIFARVLALAPGGAIVSHAAMAGIADDDLRTAGLSRQKIAYLRDLVAHVADGRLDLDTLADLSDEVVIARLTAVKGIGRWTAEMFLMFRLQRPDVLPVGDLGILKAVERLYGLPTRPKPERLSMIGEAWRPYRSVACWYLWQSLELDE